MSLRDAASGTTVFRGKRPWPMMLGSLVMTLLPAGLLGYLIYEWVQVPFEWLGGFWLVLELLLFLLSLTLMAAIGSIMLIGVAFFGWALIHFCRECLQPPAVVELLPDGIYGRTNIGDIVVPWSCIACVRLELHEKENVIGIETALWPPYPLWKDCSSGVRRMLWQRHNRRQTPLYLYVCDADASPEVILKTIKARLAHFRSMTAE